MPIFKCKMCGGNLNLAEGERICTCESCGTVQTLPRLDDERRLNLFDRANHFRRNNEFDKAMSIYETVLNEDPDDAEAYWSLILCKYGIEYVEDAATHKRLITCNRTRYTSVFADEDYKSALEKADDASKRLYADEAEEIDRIQKGILAISAKEEPFDVFICYKETDSGGRRTQDSVLAQELYYNLTNEGYKVFFSRITLEDKLGSAYEPYIFAALTSAKVMVVVTTRSDYVNAPWVKNEWARYLAMTKDDPGKVLIPAYRDMDPYDLPDEFSHLQAQDMSKLGFMQDLVRGIKKILGAGEPKASVKKAPDTESATTANLTPMLKRMFLFLEDGEFDRADDLCEQILNQDPENGEAYLGKLMIDLRIPLRRKLEEQAESLEENKNYQKVLRYGSEPLKAEIQGYISAIADRNEQARKARIYTDALQMMNNTATQAGFQAAEQAFRSIPDFKDANARAEECADRGEAARKDEVYISACTEQRQDTVFTLKSAIEIFTTISGWRDADTQIIACQNRIEELNRLAEEKRLAEERQAELNRIKREKAIKRAKKNRYHRQPDRYRSSYLCDPFVQSHPPCGGIWQCRGLLRGRKLRRSGKSV